MSISLDDALELSGVLWTELAARGGDKSYALSEIATNHPRTSKDIDGCASKCPLCEYSTVYQGGYFDTDCSMCPVKWGKEPDSFCLSQKDSPYFLWANEDQSMLAAAQVRDLIYAAIDGDSS